TGRRRNSAILSLISPFSTPVRKPAMPVNSVWIPVSSATSRTAASSARSPGSTNPAGNDHFPFSPPYVFLTTSHSPLPFMTVPAAPSQTFPLLFPTNNLLPSSWPPVARPTKRLPGPHEHACPLRESSARF